MGSRDGRLPAADAIAKGCAASLSVNACERLAFNITTFGVRDQTAETANPDHSAWLDQVETLFSILYRIF